MLIRMVENIEKIQEIVKKLSTLGTEMSKTKFSYKIAEGKNSKYWEDYIENLKNRHDKGKQYYSQIYLLMDLIEKDKAGIFLLKLSKLEQIVTKFQELLEEIKENPSIMSPKDKQQSKWSKDIRMQTLEHSEKSLKHEKEMNRDFREFYDLHIKKIIEI